MNAKHQISEKGQVIVYLVLGLVVFLGFVAFAIDGSMVLADRRNQQNAADAASLAGGGKTALDLENNNTTANNWSCGDVQFAMNNGEYSAITRAKANNFIITNTVGIDHNYVDTICNSTGKFIDITVEISATTPSNFLQLIFPRALHNEVEAVTRIYPGGGLAFGNAIVALNPDTCAGASKTGAGFRGNSETVVTGGGIFSNGCLTGGGSAAVDVAEPYDTSYNDFFGDKTIFTPPPVDVSPDQIPPESYYIALPAVAGGQCSDPDANNISAQDLMDLNKNPLTLDPGLWCITGNKNLTINSNASAPFHANGVTFYIVQNIEVTINGGAFLEITAPDDDPDPDPAIPGLVLYIPASNNAKLTINGDSNLTFTGTILAPGSHIKINGTSGDFGLRSQVIGWDVELIGSATIDVNYDGGEQASLPTSMELYR
jgi:hypothetical protein